MGRLGLGEKSRRHVEEINRSRTVWSGQVGQEFMVFSPLPTAWNEKPVSSLAANACEIHCQTTCPFSFSLINLQKGSMR